MQEIENVHIARLKAANCHTGNKSYMYAFSPVWREWGKESKIEARDADLFKVAEKLDNTL